MRSPTTRAIVQSAAKLELIEEILSRLIKLDKRTVQAILIHPHPTIIRLKIFLSLNTEGLESDQTLSL